MRRPLSKNPANSVFIPSNRCVYIYRNSPIIHHIVSSSSSSGEHMPLYIFLPSLLLLLRLQCSRRKTFTRILPLYVCIGVYTRCFRKLKNDMYSDPLYSRGYFLIRIFDKSLIVTKRQTRV